MQGAFVFLLCVRLESHKGVYMPRSIKFSCVLMLNCHFMQGVDPDAPEDDEENDVDDVDGDLEETELV